MELKIIKSQGSGNDFFLIDIRGLGAKFTDRLKRQIAVTLCSRQSAWGADGILFVDDSAIGDAKMIIFNADGSEAEMCGNGIRIVGRYVAEDAGQKSVEVENKTGIIYTLTSSPDYHKDVIAYEMIFPKADFRATSVPIITNEEFVINDYIKSFSNDYRFTAMALPNPHIVAFVDDIKEKELIELGKNANSCRDVFPNGVNVNLGKVINRANLFVATYERGVGITNSCGTGMFATAVSSVNNNLSDFERWITLSNKGGYTNCFINKDFSGKMVGNASYIFEELIDFDPEGNVTSLGKKFYEKEIQSYDSLLEQVNATLL